jgi:hypothetical protein
MSNMWTLLRHLLCLNHDYGITAEPGAIFMRCRKCGHRTAGWHVDAEHVDAQPSPPSRNSRDHQPEESALGLRMSRRAVRDA